MRHFIAALLCLLVLSACNSLPPREEMLIEACKRNPCREPTRINLTDSAGQSHEFRIPRGPIFAGGILSVVIGETQALSLTRKEDQRFTARWVADPDSAEADLVLSLSRVTVDGESASRLRILNRRDTALRLDLEQFPVGEERFHPLPIAAIPPERAVRRDWPHTILEIQLTGIRAAP